jgi:hypothetical protein
MERRNQILFGAVGSILAIIFIALLLRSCGRQDSGTTESATGNGVVTFTGDEDSDTRYVAPCTADPKTGMCYPRSSNAVADTFDMENFVAQVATYRSSSSASSDSSQEESGFASSDEFESSDDFEASDSGSTIFRSSRSSSSSRIRSSSSSTSAARGNSWLGSTSSSRFGSRASSSSTSSSRFGSRSTSSRSASTRSTSSRRSSSSAQSLPPNFVPTYSDSDTATVRIINGSNGSTGGGGSNGGGNGSNGNGSNPGGSGGTSGGSGSGSGIGSGGGGTVGSVNRTHCDPSRSLLNIFDVGDLTTGTTGWTFPVLLNGDCPITAAMIRVNKSGGFGGPLDDF